MVEEKKNYVYVIGANGTPLMPTDRAGWVRKMLRDNKAKVVRRMPFTIQLLYETAQNVQPITLGVDAGHRAVALSASSEGNEYYSAEMRLRKDVKKQIKARKDFRRKRNSKKRYRPLRVQNRGNMKKNEWLTVTGRVKLVEQIQAIKRAMDIMPIAAIHVEVAEFDFDRYLREADGVDPASELMAEYNFRQYALWCNHYKCSSCKGKEKDHRLVVFSFDGDEICGSRSNIVLCRTCYDKFKNGRKKILPIKKEIFPSDVRWFGNTRLHLRRAIQELFPDVEIVEYYGYQTKAIREGMELSKSFLNDAFVLTGNRNAARLGWSYYYVPLRRHDRSLHAAKTLKGGVRRVRKAAFIQNGFCLWEKVLYDGRECFVAGRRKSGFFLLKTLSGEVVHTAAHYSKLKHLELPHGCCVEKREKGNTLFNEFYPIASGLEK